QIERKTVDLGPGHFYAWQYTRLANGYTNPFSATVWDPFGNDTVYYFHASRLDAQGFLGLDPEDGWAPEWNDGMNYRIDYFTGPGADRVLVRSVSTEHTADPRPNSPYSSSRDRCNVRAWKETTTFHDDDGRFSTRVYSDWDRKGHWRQ